ncbi:MAG: acetyl-CoA carboxylase biotin carboxyl carrier protein subunit [Citricoccus sp.]|jgi:acetyl-CoA carboxylase biotin carboxyl carrier protein|nr:acetyl-CoA carboxylase biotin carboxyl carrier protein subunit [Citricoccus sp. WCRC_4]
MAEIQSPLPGVFYRRPGPDKDPYVQEGERVESGQVIGMVEVMKQFTEVKSDTSGTLERFVVEDSAMVNPGDALAVVAQD